MKLRAVLIVGGLVVAACSNPNVFASSQTGTGMTRKLFLGDFFCWLIKVVSFGLFDLCGDKDIDPCSNPSPGEGFQIIRPFQTRTELTQAVANYLDDPMLTQEFGATMNDWDISELTSLASVFLNRETFDEDISCWDVARVTNFSNLFNGATTFNQNIGRWNVSAGQLFQFMFFKATAFDQDIGGWDVSSSQAFDSMFQQATDFNQDVSGWDVSGARFFKSTFRGATAFNQDMCEWGLKISNAEVDVARMFEATSCPEKSDPALSVNPSGPFCVAC